MLLAAGRSHMPVVDALTAAHSHMLAVGRLAMGQSCTLAVGVNSRVSSQAEGGRQQGADNHMLVVDSHTQEADNHMQVAGSQGRRPGNHHTEDSPEEDVPGSPEEAPHIHFWPENASESGCALVGRLVAAAPHP